METATAIKSGRAFNGFEKDRGKIIHIVPKLPPGCGGDWFETALCGAKPGRRGNGWYQVKDEATCPKCLIKVKEMKI